jgi:alpha-glucosidase (family GH31 glycosyl hydrolase)
MQEKKKYLTLIAVNIIVAVFISGTFALAAYRKEGQYVYCGNARFTVLSPTLIRMEYAKNANFIDENTVLVINRSFPKTNFSVYEKESFLFIETENLQLKYKIGAEKFDEHTLRISWHVNDMQGEWFVGKIDRGNLGGTTHSLDGANAGNLPNLGEGILSREGWFLLDDSWSPLWGKSRDEDWVKENPDEHLQDLYFFAYGKDYKHVLKEYITLTGKIPMLPRYAFGIWYSRYWPYTDTELKEIVNRFRTEKIPLDVLVIDVDWHLYGWEGYDWNPQYFPKPEEFLKWLKEQNVRVTLNNHPASPLPTEDSHHSAACKVAGITGENAKKPIYWDLSNKNLAKAFVEAVHWPLEKMGVDFWWIDGNPVVYMKGLNSTLWTAKVYYDGTGKWRKDEERERPLIFSRYGGLGQHRYPIGFSGDTYSQWEVLNYQIKYTARAGNVLFPYWSHDIGGFLGKKIEPELYVRWCQFGVFSPVVRLHSDHGYRLPWDYGDEVKNIVKEYFILRHKLFPYIYTYSRIVHDTGLPLCRPLYIEYPDLEEAYLYDYEYLFGKDILVAPIAESTYKVYADITKEWRFKIDKEDVGEKEQWYAANFNDTSWEVIDGGMRWDELKEEYKHYDGYAWYRKKVFIPKSLRGKKLRIVFPGVDDAYTLYINGEKAATYGSREESVWATTTMPEISKYIKFGEDNIIAVKVWDYGGEGGLTKGPIRIVYDRGFAAKEVYLPPGTWIDFFTNEQYKGPVKFIYSAELSKMPIFVRAGAIIPMYPEMRYIGEKQNPLTLHIYAGDNGRFSLYEDDGLSYDYTKGLGSWTEITTQQNNDTISITISPTKGTYKGQLQEREYNLIIHNVLCPATVTFMNKKIDKIESVAELGKVTIGWTYLNNDKFLGDVLVKIPKQKITQQLNITLTGCGNTELMTLVSKINKLDRHLLHARRIAIEEDLGAEIINSIDEIHNSLENNLKMIKEKREISATAIGDLEKRTLSCIKHIWKTSGKKIEEELLKSALLRNLLQLSCSHKFNVKKGTGELEVIFEFNSEVYDKDMIISTKTINISDKWYLETMDTSRLQQLSTEGYGFAKIIVKPSIEINSFIGELKVHLPFELSWEGQTISIPVEEVKVDCTFVRQFYVIGPFDNENGEGLDKVYPPETEKFDLSRSFTGKGGIAVKWQIPTNLQIDLGSPVFVNFDSMFTPNDFTAAYALTYIEADKDKDAFLLIGSDDGCAVWLNGEKVFRYDGLRAAFPAQDAIKVKLKKGINTILVKVVEQQGGWGFYLQIVDENKGPLSGVRSLLTP